jgi:hypothetical protein
VPSSAQLGPTGEAWLASRDCFLTRPVVATSATISLVGGVAQLAERFVRNEEVVGSIPFISTKKTKPENEERPTNPVGRFAHKTP